MYRVTTTACANYRRPEHLKPIKYCVIKLFKTHQEQHETEFKPLSVAVCMVIFTGLDPWVIQNSLDTLVGLAIFTDLVI